ncbi:MAG: LysR family hydrogen peroxide-inducible transcriptional activator [Limisphaerales bacterium]|jgi:LysR family hydrogen peroxide-inducible transcriptional activator
MNLRDLRYLVAVAEHRHFGRAAEACFVSQPTLSTQLKKLEETLGVTLIERTNRRVMLSAAGEQIVEQAGVVLREVNGLIDMAEQHRDPMGGDFKLGIIPTVAPYLLPKILEPIGQRFPNLRLQLTEAQTVPLVRMLKQGELDALLLALPLKEESIEEVSLFIEPFYFAVPKDHPKAKQKSVTLSDLDGEAVLLLEDGHCLRDQALDVCHRHKAEENTNFRATSIETLRQMVNAGVGTTLMPQLAINDSAKDTRYLPFRKDQPHRELGLCWRGTSPRGALLSELGEVIRDALG